MALVEGDYIECAWCGTEDGPFEYFGDEDEYLCSDCVDELEEGGTGAEDGE